MKENHSFRFDLEAARYFRTLISIHLMKIMRFLNEKLLLRRYVKKCPASPRIH
jgi:hypothetical protein